MNISHNGGNQGEESTAVMRNFFKNLLSKIEKNEPEIHKESGNTGL